MTSFYVKADHFVLKDETVGAGYLAIKDGCFGTWSAEAPAAGAQVIDRTGRWVAPGFVDTHIHGFFGHDALTSSAEDIAVASTALAAAGTTSWTPTTLTASTEQIAEACARIYEASVLCAKDPTAARIQGIFLEGPFFSERYAGAQNPAYLCDPSVESFRLWQEQANGIICRSALAPEREGSLAYINALINMGVGTALGHSAASFDQALCAVGAGAGSFVHTYNAMSPLHHREPGMVGCAMATPAYSELIGDGIHVSYGAVAALIHAKGWDRVALITDCLSCGGLPDGPYELGGLPIIKGGGCAHLVEGGALAGSASTLADVVRNVYDWGVVSAAEAIRMASEVPARMSLIDDVCGCIAPDRRADFNVLGCGLVLEETYVGGQLVTK